MSSAQGRFTSPDPIGFSGANPADPQSWNQYAYARNNPLLYTDPDGFKYRICDANGKNCAQDQMSDADFDAEKKKAQANGEHFGNGKMYHYDSDGKRVNDGTYQQTDVDLTSPLFGAVAQGVNAAAPVTDPRFIAGFYAASAAGGYALYQAGVYAGGELITLDIGGAGATTETSSTVASSIGQGLRRQIDLHKQKLADYLKNPDAYDNKGFLKNASPELRQKIIESRIKSLAGQIENFTQQLEKLTGGK
jgi:hypothetical protein